MTDIADIFAEAKQDALLFLMQKEWLSHLIKTWRKRPFISLAVCCAEFEVKHTGAKFKRLKAYPEREKNHFNYTVTRYFAAFLPCTSNALWDGIDDDSALRILMRERFLDVACDQRKLKGESRMRFETKKINAAEKASAKAHADNNERSARRNWSAVK